MKSGFTHEQNSKAKKVEWYTPEYLFRKLGIVFDLDPTAPEGGLSWIPVRKFYSKKDDGLIQPLISI